MSALMKDLFVPPASPRPLYLLQCRPLPAVVSFCSLQGIKASLEGEVQELVSDFLPPLRGLPEAWRPGRGRKEKTFENSEAEEEILRRY